MQIKQDVIAAIGNTPLIRLRHASEATGCEPSSTAPLPDSTSGKIDEPLSRAPTRLTDSR